MEDGIEEFAPLDLLIQSMGRRNRSAEKDDIGRADIIKIKNDKGFEGYKIYNSFNIQQTEKILSRFKSLDEKEIYLKELLDDYYSEVPYDKTIESDFENLKFEDIDKKFKLFEEAPLSFSFFLPLNNKAKKLWNQLVILDIQKKELIKNRDRYFWKNMKLIDEKYSKIKKEVSQYIINQNFYYQKESDKEQVRLILQNDFDKALDIYLANEDVYDNEMGLNLVTYVKNKLEGLFW